MFAAKPQKNIRGKTVSDRLGFALVAFKNQIEPVILHSIHQRCNGYLWIPQSKPLYLAQYEIHLVPDFKHGRIVMEMFFRLLLLPSGIFHKPLNELLLPRYEVHHPALRMTDERKRLNTADGNRIGYFELTIPQIGAPRSNDIGKIVGDVDMLPVVHTHTDEQLCARI